MKSRLNTGLAKLRVRIMKDASGKPMSQEEAAKMLKIPLPTYVAYERGARKLSRRIAEQLSATWYVRLDYLLEAPPTGDPISISGEALTPEVAWQHAIGRQFGFETWNAQHRTTKLAELLFLNIHGAIQRLSWGSYYSRKGRPAGPPKRYRELKECLIAKKTLSESERSELETLGKKWAKRKETDFKKLRAKGHKATEGFLFDALGAIREMLHKHNLPHEVLPDFDTLYTPILENILEDPEAPIIGWAGKEIEFRPMLPGETEADWLCRSSNQRTETEHDRALRRIRRDYHLRDDALWEIWRPKLESLAYRYADSDPLDAQPLTETTKEAITGDKPLTEAEIRALFDPVRKRMEGKGFRENEIRARLDAFRKRQRDAEGKVPPLSF
jgi:transcriptional regulator with XRE-family HTH domain